MVHLDSLNRLKKITSNLYEKNDIFSVRSAYKLAMEGRSKNNYGTSTSADRNFFMQYGKPWCCKK
jgi:hypothetical protein